MSGPIVGAQFWYNEWKELDVANERLLIENQRLKEELEEVHTVIFNLTPGVTVDDWKDTVDEQLILYMERLGKELSDES